MCGPRPGDKCNTPGCVGVLTVQTTRIDFVLSERRRYLGCETCGKDGQGVWRVPLEFAPPRKKVQNDSYQ